MLLGLVGGVVGLVAASFMQAVADLDDELPVLRRARLLVHADAAHRRRVARLRAGDGLRRRLPAGVRARRGWRSSTRCGRRDERRARHGTETAASTHRPPVSASVATLFIVPTLLWGSTWYAITLQLGVVAPEVSVAYRFALAAVLLAAWCVVTRRSLAFSACAITCGSPRKASRCSGSRTSSSTSPSNTSRRAARRAVRDDRVRESRRRADLLWRPPDGAGDRGRRARRRRRRAAVPARVRDRAGGRADGEGHRVRVGVGARSLRPATWSPSATTKASLPALARRRVGDGVRRSDSRRVFAVASGAAWTFDPRRALCRRRSPTSRCSAASSRSAPTSRCCRAIGAGPASYTGVAIPVVAMTMSTLLEGYRWTAPAVAGVALVVAGNMLGASGSRDGAAEAAANYPAQLRVDDQLLPALEVGLRSSCPAARAARRRSRRLRARAAPARPAARARGSRRR